MGQCFEFRCPDCGYTVQVIGGVDYGMRAGLETMVCLSCKAVIDILVRVAVFDQTGRLVDWEDQPPQCPQCRGVYFKTFNDPWSCPKCDGNMIKSGEPVVFWD